MRIAKIMLNSGEIPTPTKEYVNYYILSNEDYLIVVDLFPGIADLFDWTYNNNGLHYCPADEFEKSDLYNDIMGDENLSTFFGYYPFAKSNMPSELVG